MKREQCLEALIAGGVVAVVRIKDAAELVEISLAISRGGVKAVEITMTSPGALAAISEASRRVGEEAIIGAGTVLDPETARMAILAGARFVVGPVLNESVVKMCRRYDVPCILGAFTPTEILNAWETGADAVKVFPITALGPSYIKDILGPFPDVKLAPTGGINLTNLGEFLKAGAVFVGVGNALVDKAMVAGKKWDELSIQASRFAEAVKISRG